jgi:pyruvate/2-oxoglutarate dehydrogenase complex dihydrolipoamide acyltransferase (E2) component
MSIEVVMPQLGFAMEEGRLVEWLVPQGGAVTQGQPLFSLETDKAVQEIEAPASGSLTILKQADGTYPVGTVLGLVE